MQKHQKQDDFLNLLRGFRTAMLTTKSLEGDLRSRPMAVAEVCDDATVFFATDVTSVKVDEAESFPHVNVSCQSRDTFLSLSGSASIVRDRGKIRELWQPTWNIWFPDGKEDLRLSLLRVDGERGEYWDMSGLKSVAYLWEAGKALLTGEVPENAGDHGKLRLK